MMEQIGFNLSVFAVPVIPGHPGTDERLARLGEVPTRYLPPAPRVAAPTGALCDCGARGAHRGGERHGS
jgi:hypothetical protein